MLYGLYVGQLDAWYVGQSKDLKRRLTQHRSRPPKTVARVLDAKPGEQFTCHILGHEATQKGANKREAQLIKAMGTLNNLPGHPTGSRKGWVVMKSSINKRR